MCVRRPSSTHSCRVQLLPYSRLPGILLRLQLLVPKLIFVLVCVYFTLAAVYPGSQNRGSDRERGRHTPAAAAPPLKTLSTTMTRATERGGSSRALVVAMLSPGFSETSESHRELGAGSWDMLPPTLRWPCYVQARRRACSNQTRSALFSATDHLHWLRRPERPEK